MRYIQSLARKLLLVKITFFFADDNFLYFWIKELVAFIIGTTTQESMSLRPIQNFLLIARPKK